jgi:hypothetical protein
VVVGGGGGGVGVVVVWGVVVGEGWVGALLSSKSLSSNPFSLVLAGAYAPPGLRPPGLRRISRK